MVICLLLAGRSSYVPGRRIMVKFVAPVQSGAQSAGRPGTRALSEDDRSFGRRGYWTMLSDLILNGALPWVVIVTVAVVASTALLRWFPSLRHSMESVEAGRVSPIDGLRGFLGLSVFVHH